MPHYILYDDLPVLFPDCTEEDGEVDRLLSDPVWFALRAAIDNDPSVCGVLRDWLEDHGVYEYSNLSRPHVLEISV